MSDYKTVTITRRRHFISTFFN